DALAFGGITTETNARATPPFGRNATLKNLYCVYTAPPGSNATTATLYKNGSPTSLTVTIPTGGSGTQVVSDTNAGHAVSLTAATDTFDLLIATGGGTAPTISSCSVGIY